MPAKPHTAAQRKQWDRIAELGCQAPEITPHGGRITIHHCYTGGGGRKNHDEVVGLCWNHHVGPEGIDGKKMSKRAWQIKYISEIEMRCNVQLALGELEPLGPLP